MYHLHSLLYTTQTENIIKSIMAEIKIVCFNWPLQKLEIVKG